MTGQLPYRFASWIRSLSGIHKVNTPTVLQMEAVECGAAALGIVLGYYKKYVPLEKLRVDCGVSRNGSNAANIAKAARKYGLDVKAYKKEPEDLRSLPLPMIVFWNFYHFLVVEGFAKNKFYLNDPASGPRVVSSKIFDESFTGVVLTFKPDENFSPGGEKPRFLSALAKRLKDYKKTFLYLTLAGLALVVPGLAIPEFSKIFVDNILIRHVPGWILPMMIGLGITALLRALLSWLQFSILLRFEMSLSLGSSSKFLWRVLHLPMNFHIQRSAGDLSMRVNINDQIAQMLSGQLGTTFLNLLMIVFYAGLMFYYSISLTVIVILLSLLNLVALRYISRKRVDANQRIFHETGKMFGLVASGFQMIESMKASASESDFFSKWGGFQSKLLNIQQKLNTLTQTLQVIPILLTAFTSLIILVMGSLKIISGEMSIGTLVAIQTLAAAFSHPIQSLVNLGSTLQDVEGGMKRIDDVYNYPVEEHPKEVAASPGMDKVVKLEGLLELRDITFGYSLLEPPLIENFSLKLHPGSRVAIIGKTGCGKSTIAFLVSGLYKPWKGEILFDGKIREEIPARVLTNSIAMVDQNIFLYEGTVRDNITLWDKTVSEKDVIQAAKDACIHQEVAERPGAYMSPVAENGRNFSGGQKQRLEITRALVTNPSILILDEATSSLDAQTEYLIDLNIRKKGCTTLVIAHRLSTIRDCDEIIVLHRGKIVQRGTHEQLYAVEGPYKELIQE
jgi:NHLM bacteriocin system ABC transporter peptidase/ATP-binding protein